MDRQKQVKRVLWWTWLGNIVVAAAKLAYGFWAHSFSMRADGIHSLLDSSSNIIALVGLALAAKPADPEHPYGHHKMEVLVSWFIGFSIFYGMVQMLQDIFGPRSANIAPGILSSKIGFAIAIATLIVNASVSYWEHKKGKELQSAILLADANHTFSDIFVTLGVMVSLAAAHMGFFWADKIIALIIAGVIGWVAIKIFVHGGNVFLDRAQIDAHQIEAIARQVEGVIDCHRVRSRGIEGFVALDCHILLDDHLTLKQAHLITHAVEQKIKAAFPQVHDLLIHTEPCSDGREKHSWEK